MLLLGSEWIHDGHAMIMLAGVEIFRINLRATRSFRCRDDQRIPVPDLILLMGLNGPLDHGRVDINRGDDLEPANRLSLMEIFLDPSVRSHISTQFCKGIFKPAECLLFRYLISGGDGPQKLPHHLCERRSLINGNLSDLSNHLIIDPKRDIRHGCLLPRWIAI